MILIHDRTALHAVETALRKSEELHRRLLDVSPDAIMVQCDGQLVFANPAAVKLFRAGSEKELLGHKTLDLVHPDDRQIIVDSRKRILEDQLNVRIEVIRRICLDGTVIHCESVAAPFMWEDRSAVLVMMRDMTALHEAEAGLIEAKESAEQANRSKSRFLAAASHDLRQPIYALSIFIATMAKRVSDPKSRDLIAKMEQAIESTNKLLVAVLDISKLEAGVVEADMSDFPVQDIFDQLMTEFAPLAEAYGNRLSVVPTSLAVRSDRILLESILRNLVSNAVRYTSDGRILMGCRRDGGAVRFEIWDTGIGIPQDKQEVIFEEFHRLDDPSVVVEAGLGLGLAIVERAAKLLGYEIELESEPGRGSMFRFTVPAGVAIRAGGDSGIIAHLVPPSMLRGAVVAVIDDDRDLQDAVVQQLTGWGCDCVAKNSADSVVAALTSAERTPDLVIADYHLGDGKTGIEAIQAIRRQWDADIPAVIITGDDSGEPEWQAKEMNLPLMKKPVRAARLRALLLHLMQVQVEAGSNRARGA
jgi:PAS domain S-box-containing protein